MSVICPGHISRYLDAPPSAPGMNSPNTPVTESKCTSVCPSVGRPVNNPAGRKDGLAPRRLLPTLRPRTARLSSRASQARTPCYPSAVALGVLMLTGACEQTASEPRAGADDASVSSAPTTMSGAAPPSFDAGRQQDAPSYTSDGGPSDAGVTDALVDASKRDAGARPHPPTHTTGLAPSPFDHDDPSDPL